MIVDQSFDTDELSRHGWQRRHLPTAVAAVRQGPVIGDKLGLAAR